MIVLREIVDICISAMQSQFLQHVRSVAFTLEQRSVELIFVIVSCEFLICVVCFLGAQSV